MTKPTTIMTTPPRPPTPAPTAGKPSTAPVDHPRHSYYCPYCRNTLRILGPDTTGITMPPVIPCPTCTSAAFRLTPHERTTFDLFQKLADETGSILFTLLKEHADMQEKRQ